MFSISTYVIWFILFSFLGWVWETIFCSITKHHFQNRGFLFGPICPIYGASALLFIAVMAVIPESTPVWGLFLIFALGSAVVEFLTSWYLEKRFHARWWDYSNVPLNIQGRICLPATIGFGAAGLAGAKYLIPLLAQVSDRIPPIVFEVSALVFMGILGADFALTEAGLSQLLKRIEEMDAEYTRRGEEFYQTVTGIPQTVSEKMRKFNTSMQDSFDRLGGMQRRVLSRIQSFRPRQKAPSFHEIGNRMKGFLRSKNEAGHLRDDDKEDKA